MIVRILLLYCLLAGVVQSWAYRHAMNADGIAYLDLSDAWMRLDWKSIPNSYWSPVYPILLGIANRVGGGGAGNEFVRAHAVNFVLFLASLAAFTWFLNRAMLRLGATGLYRTSLIAGGYSLFLYSALELQANRNVSPDMGLMAVVYLAAGEILDWGKHKPSVRSAIWLGIVLGIGFWVKGVMFAVGWIFILVAIVSGIRSREHWRAGAIAAAAFVLVCAPWLAAISWERGHPTSGDTGRLNYAFLVNDVPMTHWQGQDPSLATPPLHPTRRIGTAPDAFEFANPIQGTYPPWDDPAYWYEGVTPRFHLDKQVSVLKASAAFLLRLGLRPLLPWVIAVILTGFFAARGWLTQWWITLACVAVIAMYSLVLLEGRYIAPFLTLGLFSLTAAPRPALNYVRLAAGLLTLALVGVSQINIARHPYPSRSEQVVQSLALPVGERVAVVEDGPRHYWTRLARARVVAEIPQAVQYASASDEDRRKALAALEHAGARCIVSSVRLPDARPYVWRPLAETGYFVSSRQDQEDP